MSLKDLTSLSGPNMDKNGNVRYVIASIRPDIESYKFSS